MSSSFEEVLICTYLNSIVEKHSCWEFNDFENLLPFYNASNWEGWVTLLSGLLLGKALRMKLLFVLLSKLPFHHFSLPDNTETGQENQGREKWGKQYTSKLNNSFSLHTLPVKVGPPRHNYLQLLLWAPTSPLRKKIIAQSLRKELDSLKKTN